MNDRNRWSGLLTVTALTLSGCSSARTPQAVAQQALTAMGGEAKLQGVRTLTMKDGTGTRFRLGQTAHVTDEESASQLKNDVEIADIANHRASLDYEVRDQGFVQHRHEILTKRGDKEIGIDIVGTRPVLVTSASGLFSWGTQNSPEFLLRRNIVSVVRALSETAPSTGTAEEKTFNGKPALAVAATTKWGDQMTLYVDPQSKLPTGFEVTDTETILGDVPAQYVLSDYKSVDGIMLPHHIAIVKGGKPYSEIRFASIALNDSGADKVFEVPDTLSKEADQAIAAGPDYSPVTLSKVADGVYFAAGYSHHSMIVEFPKWLAVVEAPYTEAQTQTLLRALQQQFPGKPIQYVAVTHHHYDHLGGLRGVAATGATVLVSKGHEPEVRRLIETPHTHPADELEKKRMVGAKTGSIEAFEGKKVISDGGQTLELYEFMGSPHVEPMVMAYVPRARALFQSDLWFPGAGSNGSAGTASAKQLLDTIRKLNLRVDINVGGHGGVAPFAEFEKAVAAMPQAQK